MQASRVLCSLGVMACLVSQAAFADVRLPSIIGSNMVLQADSEVAIWGWADPGERVKVLPDWNLTGAAATADEKGRWKVMLKTPAYDAQGPDGKALGRFQGHTVVISAANSRITLENVLLGEVWVCSGQSNMEMRVKEGMDAKKEAEGATASGVRLFDVQNSVSYKREDDCRPSSLGGKSAGWTECSPATVGDFSGTGYFFGRELRSRLDVPIGLISTDWGGTPAESWTSEEALKAFPEYAEPLAWMKEKRENGSVKGDDPMRVWWDKVEEIDKRVMGNGTHWREPAYDDAGWKTAKLPGAWGDELAEFDGLVWYRRTVSIPQAWVDKDLKLSLGPIDDMDATYFDGVPIGTMIGEGKWFVPREYTIPKRFVTKTDHTIAVRVFDKAGPGGMNGEASQMFLQPADGTGEPVKIDGYWRYAPSAKLADLPPVSESQARELTAWVPSSLSNAMIAPLTNFAIRGAIWYQGESNRGRAEQYSRLFPAMITDWRKQWGRGDFPFYFVQIAPFRYGGDKGETAELREAQLKTLSLPNTGMAVTMDIGNPDDIHPANKQDVGKRLALWALAKTYGKADVVYSGPIGEAVTPDGKALRVRFAHGAGLAGRGGEITGFEIAGADEKFVPATARVDGDTLLVSSDAVPVPSRVRYGWCDACAPNLVNKAGLPASPFRLELMR